MNSFKDKSTNKIAQDIINCFKEGSNGNVFSIKENKRKIMIRRYIEIIKKYKHLLILENSKVETQNWQIAYADVTLIKKTNEEDYKYIGFDIHFNLIQGIICKRIFIIFSFHALIRVIERCNIQEFSTPDKLKKFLSSMIKPILLRCLSMYEEMYEEFKFCKRNNPNELKEILKKRESYVISNNLFLPIVMEINKNTKGEISLSFTIKTVMPDTYNGAKKTIQEKELKQLKEKIFDYSDLLKDYIVIKH
jgi:ribosomal protein L24